MNDFNIWGTPTKKGKSKSNNVDIWGNPINKKSKKNDKSIFASIEPFNLNPKKEVEKDSKRSFGRTLEKRTYDNQNGKCKKCGRLLKVSHMEYHHKKFHSKGGKSTSDNIIGLCHECHKDIHDDERIKENDKKSKPKKDNNNLLFENMLGLPKKSSKKNNNPFDFKF